MNQVFLLESISASAMSVSTPANTHEGESIQRKSAYFKAAYWPDGLVFKDMFVDRMSPPVAYGLLGRDRYAGFSFPFYCNAVNKPKENISVKTKRLYISHLNLI
ncbi:hypothetical protein [Pseudomonas sp. GM17]|uniref:hypothetical protein n=1 Tax=Pseudomonas sp. GM17 TaxID=1144323 RepID=UPI001EE66A16|nr:hypothetical protein [Pseudomonas sp. GM17]WIE53136.1 hypothetical protein PMI20_015440 [Pseudomonas sp. GM17]